MEICNFLFLAVKTRCRPEVRRVLARYKRRAGPRYAEFYSRAITTGIPQHSTWPWLAYQTTSLGSAISLLLHLYEHGSPMP